MKKTPKPAPVVTSTICSICGEDWTMHQEVDGEVSTLECVRLLKAQLASRPINNWWHTQTIQVLPTPIITTPYVQPYRPYWYSGGLQCASGSAVQANTINCSSTMTPTVAIASAA